MGNSLSTNLLLMNTLDYIEREARFTFTEAVKSYADTYDRILRVLTLVFGVAGVLTSVAVSLQGEGAPVWLFWFAFMTAGSWFAIAAYLATVGLRSNTLSIGPMPYDLATKIGGNADGWYDVTYPDFKDEIADAPAGGALTNLRRSELSLMNIRIEGYKVAATKRARLLNWAYILITASPLVMAALTYVACLSR